jgi:hypothetical protein
MREQRRLKMRFALIRQAWRDLPYHKAAPISCLDGSGGDLAQGCYPQIIQIPSVQIVFT